MKKKLKWLFIGGGAVAASLIAITPAIVSCSSNTNNTKPLENKLSVYSPTPGLSSIFPKQEYDKFSSTWCDGTNSVSISPLNIKYSNFLVDFIYVKDNWFIFPFSFSLGNQKATVLSFAYWNDSAKTGKGQTGLYSNVKKYYNKSITDVLNDFKSNYTAYSSLMYYIGFTNTEFKESGAEILIWLNMASYTDAWIEEQINSLNSSQSAVKISYNPN